MRNPSGIALGTHLWLVYAFLYVPILVLILLSFNASGLPTAWGGASLKWYAKLLANASIQHAALNTLIVALTSTFIACVLGTLLALGVEMRARSSGKKGSNIADTLLMAPMIIPDIVLAIALLSFFNLLKMSLGLHSIILSHVVFNIAFVCAVVRTRLKHFDYSILEASIDLGAAGSPPRAGCCCRQSSPACWPAGCWRSPCRWTNSSSLSSTPAPAAPPPRCRCRSIR